MFDLIIGAFVGGFAAAGGFDSSESSQPSYPEPVDYSEAMMYASDNNKMIALAQVMSQEFAIQQASLDRQMQQAAQLEMGIEALDTKLQVARLEFARFKVQRFIFVEHGDFPVGVPEDLNVGLGVREPVF